MLDYKTAGALAMSYDLRLGIEVLTILEDSLKTIQEMTLAAANDDTSGVRKAAVSFRERHRSDWSSARALQRMRTVALHSGVWAERDCKQ